MVLIETSVFTRRVLEVLDADEYRALQFELLRNPGMGSVIPATHGLRKCRWRGRGFGKRGGVRVIYYWIRPRNAILLLFIFRKNERADLTRRQLHELQQMAQREIP